mmetsp:Transcript_29631/g.27086  ORF Transcript_29631/g.27086 Transcript_29631/m.27086 type:complete len:248 (-) Transcript_29631:478-1221(-)
MSESTTSSNSVKIGFSGLGEIEVDDDIYGLDIDTSGAEIRTDETSAVTLSEVVENFISVPLVHSGVNVIAGVVGFDNLLGKQFDSLSRVTEDNSLINVKFREKSVKTMNLLLLFKEDIILGDTLQGQFFHKINNGTIRHPLVLKLLNNLGESGRIHKNLSVIGHQSQELFDDRLEVNGQKLISFIKSNKTAMVKVNFPLVGKIQNSTRSGNDNMDWVVKTDNIFLNGGTTCRDHGFDLQIFTKVLND